MGIRGYRKASRIDWGCDENEALNLEQVNTGALLRIADATEKMAEHHTELIRQRDDFEREVKRLRDIRDHLERSNASLRGHLKRIKRITAKTKED